MMPSLYGLWYIDKEVRRVARAEGFWRNFGITAAALAVTALICYGMNGLARSAAASTLIFVLCVHVVARLTDGYAWGIAASIAAVLLVNFVFTYPFMEFNFTIAGYPLTFVTMLTVSISTSALTTNVKRQERLRMEGEKAKMRADLLRSVSHDLRTPLTSIAGSASVLLENPGLPEEQRRELLLGVRDDSEWLIRMVENLLSITRVGGENANIQKTPEAVEEVIADAVRKFRKLRPDVKVETQIPEDVLFVPMDAVLICQVLTNLLENAAEHGQTTSRIVVKVTVAAGRVRFAIEDDGEGIDSGTLPYLFEDKPVGTVPVDSNGRHNMGIGLTVCRTIVKAHGGDMTAANLPGGGAVFWFDLPLAE